MFRKMKKDKYSERKLGVHDKRITLYILLMYILYILYTLIFKYDFFFDSLMFQVKIDQFKLIC